MQSEVWSDLFYCCVSSENKIGVEMSNTIYHEKQVRQLCAVHALNNLFQEHGAFSKEYLDEICSRLSPNTWISPHKSLLGLGNYDINVIMSALQLKGYEAIWFDKRKCEQSEAAYCIRRVRLLNYLFFLQTLLLWQLENGLDPKDLNLAVITGFILNIPTDYKVVLVQLLLSQKHWVAIREFQGSYYNLDSKLDCPELIGSGEDLITYLRTQLKCKEKELFVVIPSSIDRSQAWRLPDSEKCLNGSMRVILPRSASSEDTRTSAGGGSDSGTGRCKKNHDARDGAVLKDADKSPALNKNNSALR